MKVLYLFLIILFFSGCQSDLEFTQDHQWKFGEGYHIGDVLNFEGSMPYQCTADTVFFQDTARAVILEVSRRPGVSELKIKSINSERIGTYYEF